MKNVTITVDEKVAQWARVEAAKAGKSLSRWVGERLETDMKSSSSQAAGLKALLALPLASLTEGGKLPRSFGVLCTVRVFVNSNVIVYARDRAARAKRATAIEWLAALAAQGAAVVEPASPQ